MNNDKYCVGVFFDLKKAFDICSHEILLMKLSRMGIRGTALDWFRSYLSERKQVVDINDLILMILFLCYINDLQCATELFTLMFAGDTFCLNSDEDIKTLIQNINVQINRMAVWFRANKLAVNINKTKYIIFTMRGKNWLKYSALII